MNKPTEMGDYSCKFTSCLSNEKKEFHIVNYTCHISKGLQYKNAWSIYKMHCLNCYAVILENPNILFYSWNILDNIAILFLFLILNYMYLFTFFCSSVCFARMLSKDELQSLLTQCSSHLTVEEHLKQVHDEINTFLYKIDHLDGKIPKSTVNYCHSVF